MKILYSISISGFGGILMKVGILALLISGDGYSQTFLNGSFESTSVVGDQINMTSSAFNVAMANTYSFGSLGDMDIITSSTWGPPQLGSWYVGLTGGGTDIITMKLAAPLVTGTTYTIKFWDRGYSVFPVFPVQLGLSTTNTTVGTPIYTGPTPTLGTWNQRVATFIAPNNGQYISVLMPIGSTGNWVNVDNFTFATPLPVELISFTGKNLNSINNLEWETASEINNDFFSIERSIDGDTFENIGMVSGQGTTSQKSSYYFQDRNVFSDKYYYRLKQVDYNGDLKYSKIILIENKSTVCNCGVYSEDGNTVYTLSCTNLNNVALILYDINGKKLQSFENISDSKFVIIDLNPYKNGIYILKIIGIDKIETVKLLKK